MARRGRSMVMKWWPGSREEAKESDGGGQISAMEMRRAYAR